MDHDKVLINRREEFKKSGGKNCMTCPGKNPNRAIFQCLNCESTYMCESCKNKHIKNPRHKNHKCVSTIGLDESSGLPFVKVEEQQCSDHL
jgi:hypothetical protein